MLLSQDAIQILHCEMLSEGRHLHRKFFSEFDNPGWFSLHVCCIFDWEIMVIFYCQIWLYFHNLKFHNFPFDAINVYANHQFLGLAIESVKSAELQAICAIHNVCVHFHIEWMAISHRISNKTNRNIRWSEK